MAELVGRPLLGAMGTVLEATERDRARRRRAPRRAGHAVGRCLSCFAMEHELPEDSLVDLIRDEEAGRLRGRRTKLVEIEKKTGIAFERSEEWWVVSLWGVGGVDLAFRP